MSQNETPPSSAPPSDPAAGPSYVPIPTPEPRRSRRMIIALVLVAVVAGAGGFAYIYTQTNLLHSPASASTQPNAGYNTYSNYGFSFQYPKTWTITERGLFDNSADTSSGIVIAQSPSSQNDLVFVAWTHSVQSIDPSTVLSGAINGFQKGSGGTGLTVGQQGTTSTKAGYSVTYQPFSISVSGTHVDGIWSAWYSTHGQRVYQLSFVSSTQDDSGTYNSFTTYLSSVSEQ